MKEENERRDRFVDLVIQKNASRVRFGLYKLCVKQKWYKAVPWIMPIKFHESPDMTFTVFYSGRPFVMENKMREMFNPPKIDMP